MTSDDLKRLYEDFMDDEIFARESLVVLDKQGNLVPMIHGPAQQRLHARARRQAELQKALRLLFLKSRQVWGSVYVASRIFKKRFCAKWCSANSNCVSAESRRMSGRTPALMSAET